MCFSHSYKTHGDQNDGHTLVTHDEIRAKLDGLLQAAIHDDGSNNNNSPFLLPNFWNVVSSLLQRLTTVATTATAEQYVTAQNDPTGRFLLTQVLSCEKNPAPTVIVDTVLKIYPQALEQNPAAFWAASQGDDSRKAELWTLLSRHLSRHEPKQCPYPWILSDQISAESAKIVLSAYPVGVFQPSPFLDSFNLVDYLLVSPEVTKRRNFDEKLWTKFKLVLVAAGCPREEGRRCPTAPVQVILKQVFSKSDFWSQRDQVEHVLWLLHQLRWTDHWIFQKKERMDHGSYYYPIHFVLSHKCPCVDQAGLVAARALAQLLLEACQVSAAHRVDGKLALHMAIENGWPCHDLLLAAFPDALNAPDPATELFPFQVAAKHHQMSPSPVSLDVTFDLLRANPSHVEWTMIESRAA